MKNLTTEEIFEKHIPKITSNTARKWAKIGFEAGTEAMGEFKKQEVELAVEKLRDDIEAQSMQMNLIKDSEFIQILGSIIGRLNLILNHEIPKH